MVFQAMKRGWRRATACVLLSPMFAGGLSVAEAQSSPPVGVRPAVAPTGRTGDPKQLLADGRRALSEGRFDAAQDLARQADANNPTHRWGLFDDTPASLLRDIQSARSKAMKTESERLMRDARGLVARPARNDAERAAFLDQAMQMCRRAEQLHGPYSMWDLGDRPDKLARDIEAVRPRVAQSQPQRPLNQSVPTARGSNGTLGSPQGGVVPASAVDSMTPPMPGGLTPNNRISSPSPIPGQPNPDASRAAAMQLMLESKMLMDKGEFIAAKAKLIQADRTGAQFSVTEPNPTMFTQELNIKASEAITRWTDEAAAKSDAKEEEKARAVLELAASTSKALGLYHKPLEDLRAKLTPPAKPVAVNPPGQASVSGTGSGTTVPARVLLDQAALEFRKGELDVAATLLRKAHAVGNDIERDQAGGMLNMIDIERNKQRRAMAVKAFDAAAVAAGNKEYKQALGVLNEIEPQLLPDEKQKQREALIAKCRAETDSPAATAIAKAPLTTTAAIAPAAGTQYLGLAPVPADPAAGPPVAAAAPPAQVGTPPAPMATPPVPVLAPPVPGGNLPGTARVGELRPAPESLGSQADAMRQVTFQRLRSDGLKTMAEAQASWGRGDTDIAIQMLVDYQNRVRSANLPPSSTNLLLKPVDARMDLFRVMKGQTDALTRVNRENREARNVIAEKGAAEAQRQAEVKKLVAQYNALAKERKYKEAEKVALQAKQLDPENGAIEAMAIIAKTSGRVDDYKQISNQKEEFFLKQLNDAEKPGAIVTTENPVAGNIERTLIGRRRGSGDDGYLKSRTQQEYEIELKLDRSIPGDFQQMPLEIVIDNLRELAQVPIVFDYASLEAEGISPVKPITLKSGTSISARNVLALILEQAGLSYVIENNVIKVTSNKKAKGRLFTKVFSVADLVVPVPNFAMPDYANFEKMLGRNAINAGNLVVQGINGGPGFGAPTAATPYLPANGLGNAAPVGMSAQNGIGGGSGNLQTSPADGNGPSPLGGTGTLAAASNNKHEQLIRLLTSMVRPYSWDGAGGPGRVQYFDLGCALVVNQTADVIREVADLLEALRRLQDLAIAVEIRIISLSETFYERMGVDFSLNVTTNNTKFEPNLTTGTFRPEPFINSYNGISGVTSGLTPAGTLTPDLGVPIQNSSFGYAVPPFGGYPNNPGADGGVSLGLAFLNQVQVYLFMEAAQGDRRVNVMQAPKLTLFNGQTATLAVQDSQFFVTSVQVISVNGQIVFVPQNNLLPGPNTNFQIGIQAVVSADRRFVRLNLPVTLSAQTGATVPLFPITTFVTPVFEGGSQGVPIPFTQFLQQPAFTTLNVQTTVVCPDGGTVLLGGLKTLQEGRNEFGPPFLSKIPYLDRLFKNVGIGRETRHVMIMVTPRIIINAEEEVKQTESGPTGSGP